MKHHELLKFMSCLLILAVLNCCLSVRTLACPFCGPVLQTLSEELAKADATVVASLEKASPSVDLNDPSAGTSGAPYAGATFKVQKVLKGEDQIQVGDEIEVVYFGTETADKLFLIHSLGGEKLDWATPLPLSPRGVEYIEKLPSLPASGKERLKFFMGHLEDPDPLLAQDGYDEFARAPYQDIIDLKDDLDREQLMAWINDPKIGPTHRRLYLTMLGVCGTTEDAETLEALLKYDYESMRPGIATLIATMGVSGSALGLSLVNELAHADVRAKQQCLDALIAAYLKLKGAEGLPLVEERFLKNPQAEYTQLYSTIMALRFHGEESNEIPRDRLVQSLRLLLDNPDIADQVIPDLTRWEDWEIMDQLVEKFKASDEDGWIRQPVLAYLLTAAEQPGEVGAQASTAVAELEAIDPKGVKRARSYLSFGLLARAGTSPPAAEKDDPAGAQVAQGETDIAEPVIPDIEEATDLETGMPLAGSMKSSEGSKSKSASVAAEPPAPSRTMIIAIPLVVGLLLIGLFGILIRGGHTTS